LSDRISNDETFRLEISPGLSRDLPIRSLEGHHQSIASFVMLGDVELNERCASLLVDKLKDQDLLESFDILVTLEAKGITLAHEMAKLLNQPRFIVIRKSFKKYMKDALEVPSTSITSGDGQKIILDGVDIERIRGRRVCLVEDVIATGGSILAACELIEKAGAQVTVITSVLLKGRFSDSRMIYLKAPEM